MGHPLSSIKYFTGDGAHGYKQASMATSRKVTLIILLVNAIRIYHRNSPSNLANTRQRVVPRQMLPFWMTTFAANIQHAKDCLEESSILIRLMRWPAVLR